MRELRRLLGYLGPYWRDLLIVAVMIILETAFEMVIPVFMVDIIDVGVANRSAAAILQRGVQMGVCVLLALATGLLYARFTAWAAHGWGVNIREVQLERVQKYVFSNLDKFKTSSLVTRMITDVTVLQNTVNGGYRPLVCSPVMLVMGVGLSFWMNPRLALVFLVCASVLRGVLFVIVRRVVPMYGRFQKAVDWLDDMVQEGLIVIRAVKASVHGEYEEEKFQEANSGLMEASQRTFRLVVLNLPVFQLVTYTAAVLITWFNGNTVPSSGLQVGQLTDLLSYVLQVMNSMMLTSNVFLLLTRSLASVRRISEVLDENTVLDSLEDVVEEMPDGSVEFGGVSFKYHNGAWEYALSGVELHIPAEQTVGILSGIGSIKTALVQLIPRLYDATEGTVRAGDRDVWEYDLRALRDAVGIVLQKNVLLSGTVRENLRWRKLDVSDEELQAACRAAYTAEFLERMPKDLDTGLGQEGVNVSGGQKQRLCTVRILFKRPKILIFDDSTSAVDTTTEGKIRTVLAELKDVTKLIITQRATSAMHTDQIVILEDGWVHAVGTHESLPVGDLIYQEIYASQMKGGEDHGVPATEC